MELTSDSNTGDNNNNNNNNNSLLVGRIHSTVYLRPPPRAADLYYANDPQHNSKLYWDRGHFASPADQVQALTASATLYVGNLAFTTRLSQIRSHFAMLGRVKAIHMGVDRFKKLPCGFCFVEYYNRRDALAAVSLLSSTKLDGRVIRVELDAGFRDGRQYGRGKHGGQVRDYRRTDINRTSGKRQRRENSEQAETNENVAASVTNSETANNEYYGSGGPEEDDGQNDEPSAKRRRF